MIASICSLQGDSKKTVTTDTQHERSLIFGLLFQFAASSPSHQRAPLAVLDGLARTAHELGQLRVYVNAAYECVGFVIWATLTPDVERRYIGGKPRPLADWEFSDGTSAWILDFAVAPGVLRQVMVDLRDVVFKEHEQLTYYRQKNSLWLCRRISRNDRTSFMAAGRPKREGK